jgi:hypothetical protein
LAGGRGEGPGRRLLQALNAVRPSRALLGAQHWRVQGAAAGSDRIAVIPNHSLRGALLVRGSDTEPEIVNVFNKNNAVIGVQPAEYRLKGS